MRTGQDPQGYYRTHFYGIPDLLKHLGLEHIPDPVDFLAQVRGLLAPEGTLLIEVPNVRSPIAWFLFRRRWLGFETADHHFAFSPKTLGSLLTRCGFEPTSTWQPVIAGRFPGG